MPSPISNREYGQAILESIQSGSYPDSEEVVSAELPPSALPTVQRLLDQAREDVKKNIRGLSKASASDIDGWISQAKRLRNDIKDTEKTSRDIVAQAKYGEQLEGQVRDAASKLELLKREVVFTDTLTSTLEIIRGVRQALGSIERAIQSVNFLDAVVLLEESDVKLVNLRTNYSPTVAGLLLVEITSLRDAVITGIMNCWKALFHVDSKRSLLYIKDQIQLSTVVRAETIVEAFSKLSLLQENISMFCKDFNTVILNPRLSSRSTGTVYSLHVDKDTIQITRELTDHSTRKLFSDMHLLVDFLCTRLPSSMATPLAAMLVPNLIRRLISNWLSLEVPIDVKSFQESKRVLASTLHFANTLDSYGWPGKDSLVKWTEQLPKAWIDKRREISLDEVRKLFRNGIQPIETVERVETRHLSQRDSVFVENGGDHEWNAEWSDEEDDGSKADLEPSRAMEKLSEGQEDEDVTAWGLDEDLDEAPIHKDPGRSNTGDEGAEAWGWGDDNDEGEIVKPSESRDDIMKQSTSMGSSEDSIRNTREVTLKETYNITALPRGILDIITRVIYDAETLRKPEYIQSPIVFAAGDLFSLPGLVLSMFMAIAPSSYSMNLSGSMFLYNDSLWLAESLRRFTGTQFKRNSQINVGAAETEISTLEAFAKRTYSKEMESQRTILGDLLDGAQGFADCTELPFSQECDIAVSSAVDRLRSVHEQWKVVLSHSALLQSVGSLLSTVINKLIADIEDMNDISEPESQRLAAFCSRIASLEDLFTPQQLPTAGRETEQAIPLTAVYTPNWLKFQYLANILESSLVDIKYLWTEGELRLEFEAEELVDLIEALFADSEHRRKAIGEIRRASIRR